MRRRHKSGHCFPCRTFAPSRRRHHQLPPFPPLFLLTPSFSVPAFFPSADSPTTLAPPHTDGVSFLLTSTILPLFRDVHPHPSFFISHPLFHAAGPEANGRQTRFSPTSISETERTNGHASAINEQSNQRHVWITHTHKQFKVPVRKHPNEAKVGRLLFCFLRAIAVVI